MTFKTIDDITKTANTIVLKYGKKDDMSRLVIPQPVMMTLENPLFRFSCIPEMSNSLAKSVAEGIYALSGMNGSDFIREFRGGSGIKQKNNLYFNSIGQPLRFWGEKTGGILDYSLSNRLRQQGIGFIDQFKEAIHYLVDLSGRSFVISLREPNRDGGQVHSIWLWKDRVQGLQMMVNCGAIDVVRELSIRIIPSFGFIHQMISEVTNIPLGALTISVAKLYGDSEDVLLIKEFSKSSIPLVGGINDFVYPPSNLTLRDVDMLISMMFEFVGRLDEKSLTRANPYMGDSRVKFWSDMAEVFRINKARELGHSIESEGEFIHPQLRYVYKGVTI